MEEARPQFGSLVSADVKLWLTDPNKESNYERNPVHLHSAILKRSEFFEVKMSERWPSDKPTEIRVITSHDFDDYLKCIQLMYGECLHFSNVEECLSILSVASELLLDECVNKCMEYLEAVSWSAEQESRIRDVLPSLGFKIPPDLAAKLDLKNDDHICEERVMKQMVSLIQCPKATKNRENAEKYIAGILEGNASRDAMKVICGRVLLQDFKSSIASRNFLCMRSLFKFIEQCEREILKAAFAAFCEDLEFSKYVEECNKVNKWISTFLFNYQQCGEVVFYNIIWFMNAIGDGKVIVSRDSRNSFLKTWLPIMRELCCGRAEKLDELAKGMVKVVGSLPLADKISICEAWIELYKQHEIDISVPLTLFKDLQNAHYKSVSE